MKLTRTRQVVLLAAAVIVLLLLLYPPFAVRAYGGIVNVGYHWIFDPPFRGAMVAGSTLLLEFVGVGFATALTCLACGPRPGR